MSKNLLMKQIKRLTIPFALMILISAGCQPAVNYKTAGIPDHPPISNTQEDNSVSPHDVASTVEANDPQSKGFTAEADTKKLQISATPNDHVEQSGDAAEQKNKDEHVFADEHIRELDTLTLLDLRVNDPIALVTIKYGSPADQFIIEDQHITVYEYAHFTVGFNKFKKIEFIEIHSSEIDPKLNGLLLGGNVLGALEALGKPDSQSSFVLSYRSRESVLKLDIDPNTDTVLSIKLFAAR